MPGIVKIAGGDALNSRHVQRCLQQLASAYTGTDGCEAHGVAGRDRARRSPQRLGLQQSKFRSRSGCYSACSNANELTTSPRIMIHAILLKLRIGIQVSAISLDT